MITIIFYTKLLYMLLRNDAFLVAKLFYKKTKKVPQRKT